MLNISIIGIGNAGGQVAELANKTINIPAMAINSSENDLATISDSVKKYTISHKDVVTRGAAKNRTMGKKYLKDSVLQLLSDKQIIDFINKSDIVFIVSSTGGGTGSGTAPMMTSILSSTFVDTKFIMIGITPVNNEALSSQVNSLEYLKELYDILKNQTYMLYDNDKYADMPSYQMMKRVNEEIVKDIDVIRCTYNYPTPYDSIDEEDMKRLVSFPGLLNVVRLEGIKEKDINNSSIEALLLQKIKNTAHVDFQHDKMITATGIISNLNEDIGATFNNHIPSVFEYIGTPYHDFNHVAINTNKSMENNVYFIMSGLSPVADKIQSINERVDDIQNLQKNATVVDTFDGINLKALTSEISEKDSNQDSGHTETNLMNIFNMFDV